VVCCFGAINNPSLIRFLPWFSPYWNFHIFYRNGHFPRNQSVLQNWQYRLHSRNKAAGPIIALSLNCAPFPSPPPPCFKSIGWVRLCRATPSPCRNYSMKLGASPLKMAQIDEISTQTLKLVGRAVFLISSTIGYVRSERRVLRSFPTTFRRAEPHLPSFRCRCSSWRWCCTYKFWGNKGRSSFLDQWSAQGAAWVCRQVLAAEQSI